MRLLTELLLLPLAPVRFTGWLAETVAEAAEEEYYDPAPLLARLEALHRALDEGRIGLADFEREEDRLLLALQQRQSAASRLPLDPTGRNP